MVTVEFTYGEVYNMVKLYDTLLDMDLIDDCPVEVETALDKIREAEVRAWAELFTLVLEPELLI